VTRSQDSASSQIPAWVYGVFVVWLLAGYAVALALVAGLPLPVAAWQGALCLAANPALLFLVIKVVGLPKRLRWVPRSAFTLLGTAIALGQFVLPWLGWTLLLWLLNYGRFSWAEAAAAAAAVACFSYITGFAVIALLHPRASDVVTTHRDIAIPGLPRAFDGYRILHLSDLHGGHFPSTEDVRARLGPAFSVRADLVAFTGDLADRGVRAAEAVAEILAGLEAADGVAAVLGNHDHWIGEERLMSALSGRGIAVLANRHITLKRDGETLYLAGVNDASYTERDDLAAAFDGIPEQAPVVLLSHAPDIVCKRGAERAALILSGHTHGGQVVLPRVGPVYVPSRLGRHMASGLHQVGGQLIFISRGLGEVFPPIRINCPPEIALLTLRHTPDSD
jgi:predicted MPP superfamily phosphohydrolase